jgi:YVTN family beta-propeller protein
MLASKVLALAALGLLGAAAQTPQTALLVLNKDEASLAIVDPATKKVVGRVATGEGPHEIAVSADGRIGFVSNYGSKTPGSSLSVIDLVAQKELHRVDLGVLRRPHGLYVAGGKLYFTAEVSKLIGRYDPDKNQVDWLLGTGQNTTHMVMVTPDLSKILTANIGSNSVSLFESAPNGNWNQFVIPVGRGPEGLDFSHDGKELWVANSQDGTVSVIDIAARKVTATIDVQTKRSNRLKFTPEGDRVLISDLAGGEVLVLDVASRQVLKHIAVGTSPEGILMDGSRAFVAVTGENAIVVLDLKLYDAQERFATGKGPDGMAWAVRK